MKKTINIFRATNVSNTVRLLTVFCLIAIIGTSVLLLSIPSVRNDIKSWFGFNTSVLTKKNVTTNQNEEPGLADTAVINNNNEVRPLTFDDHLWGNISAPVQLIVYMDFECPFCLQYYETLNRVKNEFGNDLVIAVRNFPLANHPQALPAALAAECAAQQDKFFEMYHSLFALSKAGDLNSESITTASEKIGLEKDAFTACLTNREPEAKIVAQKDEVRALGVGGTPASFINGDYYAGALPYENFTYPDGTEAEGLQSLIKARLK